MDSIQFCAPVHVGDLVHVRARLTQVWRTSMEVEVEVEAEAVLTGERRLTSTAYLVYVALDETGHPTPVPSLQVVSDDERRRAKEAERRRAERLARREVPHHGAPAAEDITGTSRGDPLLRPG